MNVETENLVGNKKVVRFSKTPMMSSYLVAFAIGEFDYIQSYATRKNGSKIPCRVYAKKGTAKNGNFALDVAVKAIVLFEELFGIAYPLPKLDMVAIPEFERGAMENWGLINCKSSNVLFDPQNNDIYSKKNIALTVTHELAHQWFGNLVTMRWWSDIWLNEGFATFISIYAINKLFNDWDVWTQSYHIDTMSVLYLDSLTSSHPLQIEVSDPEEVVEAFDTISYHKGASIMRMLSTYLGQDLFFRGIRQYLTKYAFGNASTKDLFDLLSVCSNKDVNNLMSLWIHETGYPLLKVSIVNDSFVYLKQQRYLQDGSLTINTEQVQWPTPLRYISGSIQQNKISKPSIYSSILNSKNAIIEVDTTGYFKFNYEQTGFYRVQYQSSLIERLGVLVANNVILTNLDKIGIINDMMSLSKSGHASITECLKFFKYFANETNYYVLKQISETFSNLLSVWYMESSDVLSKLRELRLEIFSKITQLIGWVDNDSKQANISFAPMLRPLVILNAGLSGDNQTINEARVRFDKFMNNDANALSTDLHSSVFEIILSQGIEDDYNKMMQLYHKANNSQQKAIALAAIGSTSNHTLIMRALDLSISDNLSEEDVMSLIRSLGINPKARKLTCEFIKTNLGLLESKYEDNPFILYNIFMYTFALLTSEQDKSQLESFFANRNAENAYAIIRSCTNSINNNYRWLERDSDGVRNLMTRN